MRVVQAFVSLATILLWWSYSRQLFGDFVARTVALILALYPTIVLYDTQPLPFVWVNLANASALYALHRAQLRESWRLAALSGCFWGLSALLRPDILMLIPFLLLALVLNPGGRRKGLRLAAALILVLAATISPVTFMNIRADGSRSLVTGSGGSTLFIGNMLGAPGVGFSQIPGARHIERHTVLTPIDQPLTPEHLGYRTIARWIEGKALTAAEASSFCTREVLKYARREPKRFLFAAPAARRAPLALYALLVVYFVSATAIYVSARLRLPVILGMSVFAGLGLEELFRAVKGRKTGKIVLSGAVFLVLAGFFNLPTTDTTEVDAGMRSEADHLKPGMESFVRNERRAGLEHLRDYLQQYPWGQGAVREFLAPYKADGTVQTFLASLPVPPRPGIADTAAERAFRDEVQAAVKARDYGQVERLLTQWLKQNRDWSSYYLRAITRQEMNLWGLAFEDLEHAFELGWKFQPQLHEIYYTLATCALNAGDRPHAALYTARSLFVKEDFEAARQLQRELAAAPGASLPEAGR